MSQTIEFQTNNFYRLTDSKGQHSLVCLKQIDGSVLTFEDCKDPDHPQLLSMTKSSASRGSITSLSEMTPKVFGFERLVLNVNYYVVTPRGSELKAEWISWNENPLDHCVVLHFRTQQVLKLADGDTHEPKGVFIFQFNSGCNYRFIPWTSMHDFALARGLSLG